MKESFCNLNFTSVNTHQAFLFGVQYLDVGKKILLSPVVQRVCIMQSASKNSSWFYNAVCSSSLGTLVPGCVSGTFSGMVIFCCRLQTVD